MLILVVALGDARCCCSDNLKASGSMMLVLRSGKEFQSVINCPGNVRILVTVCELILEYMSSDEGAVIGVTQAVEEIR